MVIENGHADYGILRASSLLYEEEPDVIEARRVLDIVSNATV